MTEPGHLKPRTVAIVFGVLAVAFLALCISVGEWALGVVVLIVTLITLFLLPFYSLVITVATMIVAGLACLPVYAATRLLPRKFRAFASERDLPPVVALLIFAAMIGILMLIFRSVEGVLAGLCIIGVLVGLPWFAEWLLQRRIKKTADTTSDLTSKGRADASPGGSST